MNNTTNVSIEFIVDALQARYDNVKDLWGGEAANQLWEQALNMVEECGIGDNVTSPSIFVDNYLINGEFVSKEDDLQMWLDCEYDDLSDDDKECYECEEEYIEKNGKNTAQKMLFYIMMNMLAYRFNYQFNQ